jgi:hypothetical protein
MNTPTIKYNIADGDHRIILNGLRQTKTETELIEFIKTNMEAILVHYIGCTWGACYNTKFKELIKPYFDDVQLLDKILRSDLIKERPNVQKGRSGARIFDSLLFQLRQCESPEIRQYLFKEFL